MKAKKFGNPVTPPVVGDILNDAQTAALLGISSRTLRLWRHTRALPFLKITNREIRYKRSDIDEWLSRRRTVIAA